MSKKEQKQEVAPDVALQKIETKDINAFTALPSTFDQAKDFCNYLASSQLVPKAYQGRPQDVFVAISWGQEVGLKPMNSLRSIAVINGRPSMWGDAPLALVRKSPLCEFFLEDNEAFAYARDNVKGWEHLKDMNPNDTSICVGKRVGEPAQVREFSVADVKAANLGNVHKSYPKDMRKYKARSRLINSLFADVTNGIDQAELVQEQMELEGGNNPVNEVKSDKMADDILSAMTENVAPNKNQDISDAQVIEETENKPEEKQEKPKAKEKEQEEPKEEFVPDDVLAKILEKAEFLNKEQSAELANEVAKNGNSLPVSRAEYWKGEINTAYKASKAKDSE